jgi:hypothetical protein
MAAVALAQQARLYALLAHVLKIAEVFRRFQLMAALAQDTWALLPPEDNVIASAPLLPPAIVSRAKCWQRIANAITNYARKKNRIRHYF